MKSKQKYIGVFDSGVGGLTVVRELLKSLPSESMIYLGDTARVPYGIKSKETVIKFTSECVNFLLNFKLKAIVIACNTASSYALSDLKSKLDIPIFEVISPGVKKAVESTRNKKIGVIGTRATVDSQSYKNRILKCDKKIEVFQQSCPLFVSLAEEGWVDDDITYQIAERYLESLKTKSIDTLILGCTHYPLLKNVIGKAIGEEVVLVDSAEEVASIVKQNLENNDMLLNVTDEKNKFFVTDEIKRFIEVGRIFFGSNLDEVSRVDLSDNKIMEKVKG